MSSSITFGGKDHPLRNGKTSLSNLDVLFCAAESHEYIKGLGHIISGTDTESVEKLESIVFNNDVRINESIRAVGILMASIDHSSIEAFDLNNIGWLLTGLSELKNALDDANTVIEQTKEHLNKPSAQ